MGCQEPNDDKASTMPEEVLYNTENILVDINEKIYNNDESVKAYSIFSWISDGTNRILSGNGIPNHEVGNFLILIIPIRSVSKMSMQHSLFFLI